MFLSLLAATAFVPGAVHASEYPTPKYELRLDDYYINTVDYRFPSGLRILFQEDHTQPIVSVTNWIDHERPMRSTSRSHGTAQDSRTASNLFGVSSDKKHMAIETALAFGH